MSLVYFYTKLQCFSRPTLVQIHINTTHCGLPYIINYSRHQQNLMLSNGKVGFNLSPTSRERWVKEDHTWSSTRWKVGWVSGEEGCHGNLSGIFDASPWPTQSSGWNLPRWRRAAWSQARSPAERGGPWKYLHGLTRIPKKWSLIWSLIIYIFSLFFCILYILPFDLTTLVFSLGSLFIA